MNTEEIRKNSSKICKNLGFTFSKGLPVRDENDQVMNSLVNIGKRLYAIKLLIAYVCIPSEPKKMLMQEVSKNNLLPYFSSDEAVIFKGFRWLNKRKFIDQIGWKMENCSPLLWALGLIEELPKEFDMVDGMKLGEILDSKVNPEKIPIEEWVKQCSPVSLKQLLEKEDLYYCLHNAVRSAQLGEATVPNNFHPLINGGVVHERRHALTYTLSPETAWEDTDLST